MVSLESIYSSGILLFSYHVNPWIQKTFHFMLLLKGNVDHRQE